MVMPDWSLLVTTFPRHSWLLQRIATRVTSIFTFIGEKYPVNSAHAEFMPALARAVLFSGRSSRRCQAAIRGARPSAVESHQLHDVLRSRVWFRATLTIERA